MEPAAAAALLEELVEEIILRLPPDEPGALVRASLVCKTWYRFISSPRFRRRFREIHRAAPPMLGFFLDLWDGDSSAYVARFLRTSSSSCPPVADRRGAFAVDARHGRVLLETTSPPTDDEEDSPDYNFVVWNPITGKQKELPVLSFYANAVTAWKAAVLCACAAAAAATGTDHVACCCCHDDDDEYPFLVVLVSIAVHHVFVHVYDSTSTGTTTSWNVTSCVHLGPLSDDCCMPMGEPGVLAGGALHFAIEDGRRILSYDLANRSLSVTTTTPWNDRVGNLALVTTTTAEDGRELLGVAGVEGYNLHVWSYSPSRPDDDAASWAWTPRGTIELDHTAMVYSIDDDLAVPTTTSSSSFFRVVGFVEGANTVFVLGSDGIYAVALGSGSGGKVSKVHEPTHFFGIVPHVSFYTPDLGASY